MAERSESHPPWKRPNPKKKANSPSPKQKSAVRARARAAGRRYPNLVDKMAVARTRNTTSGSKRGARPTRSQPGG